jgi:hypothetical protein
MLTRFLFDERGRARRRPMTYTVVGLLVLALFGGTLAALTPMLHGHPTLQGIWVMLSVFALKLPLVFFLWWLIVRNKEWPGMPVVWSPEETEEILAYLRAEARRAVDMPDAAARLDYLSGEAWHVADRADGPLKGDAVAVALEIDAMRTRNRGRRPV